MESKELNLNRDCEAGDSGGGGGGADGFIDRSRVRILLCDNNEYSSEEVFTLLVKCSYQGNISFSFISLINLLHVVLNFVESCA